MGTSASRKAYGVLLVVLMVVGCAPRQRPLAEIYVQPEVMCRPEGPGVTVHVHEAERRGSVMEFLDFGILRWVWNVIGR